jgi:hypothetical protein
MLGLKQALSRHLPSLIAIGRAAPNDKVVTAE